MAETHHPEDDRLHEECGLFGIHADGEDVSRLTYFGLFQLQHRGQESAGIAVSDGRGIQVYKQMGLVSQIFDEEILQTLDGRAAIGHVRYSTTGSSILRNAQPIITESAYGSIAVAHNGNLVNAADLRLEMEARGIRFHATSDSEIIAKMIAYYHKGDIEEAIIQTMRRIVGAYSLLVLTPKEMVGVRDPYGVRPLSLGRLNGHHYVMASETCALDIVSAKVLRDIEPGEMATVDAEGIRFRQAVSKIRDSMCMFEFIYFARPDTYLYGKLLHTARRRMGHQLALEHPVEADVVVGVPDTAIPAAIGYAEQSGIPYGEGFIKNRYIHRTFIQPDQRQRDLGVRMKLTPLAETVADKRVVVVDDSIVRCTTTGSRVRVLREAGAKEVHVRVSSPPIQYPCFYGIDMADQKDLIAARMSVEEIRNYIGADTLGYLSKESLVKAVQVEKDRFCFACFDGKYPVDIPEDIKQSKFCLESGRMDIPSRRLETLAGAKR
ncbi:MAG: amidophosphoribosyltransferase [Armatimonadetes bacterium]|nr:amidophosphoribosyltransferase [Armatimonadota bacterium]